MTAKQKAVAAGVAAVVIVGGILVKNALTTVPVPFRLVIFEMRYPAGKSAKDYKLGLEYSTNLKDWRDKWFQTNGTNWETWHSNSPEFYRQKAIPL